MHRAKTRSGVRVRMATLTSQSGCGTWDRHGDLDFVQWPWDKAPTMDLLRRRRDSIFYVACRDGKLEVAKWVWNASGRTIDIRAGSACAFRNACVNGHLEVVKKVGKDLGPVLLHLG